MDENFIFVTGCPRSGTSFISRILTNNPDIAICPETHFFSSIFHEGVIRETKHLVPFDTDEKVDELIGILSEGKVFGRFWSKPDRLDYKKLKADFKNTDRSYKDLFSLVIRQFATNREANIGGEKTPTHVFHVDEMLTWYPNARAIQILRDPRAVLASQLNRDRDHRPWLRTWSAITQFGVFAIVLGEWWLATRKHDAYLKKYPDRYTLVQFETLTLEQENTVKLLCEFLGVPFSTSMLDLPVGGSAFEDREDFEAYSVIDGWKKYLPKAYDSLLRFFLRGKMIRFGYIK